MSAPARWTLLICDAFVALTAIVGGVLLMARLEAGRFPPGMLAGTHFVSYAVPGLILSLVVGGSAAVAAVAVLLDPRAGAPASVAAGAILMGWICGEVLLLDQPSWTWTELSYFAVGALMAALGLTAVRRSASTRRSTIRGK